jgi:uncharacterized protein YndB with AHSA1/START domain
MTISTNCRGKGRHVIDKGSATRFRNLSDREYELTRVFAAPRELVFAAYTDPAHVPHWWGPRGITTIVDRMDVRPGGTWRYIHRHPDGSEYAYRGEYYEVVPPERLAYTLEFEFPFEGRPRHPVVETVTLEERDGQTTLTATWLFETAEECEGFLGTGAESGMTESWSRLAEHLDALPERVHG